MLINLWIVDRERLLTKLWHLIIILFMKVIFRIQKRLMILIKYLKYEKFILFITTREEICGKTVKFVIHSYR